MDKAKAAPRRLLQSRRFWSAIISIITLLIAATRPELEEHLDVLAPTITTICVIEDRELARKTAALADEGSNESDAA